MPNASHKGMGEKGSGSGAGPASGDPRDADMLDEVNLAADRMGSSQLQADGEGRHHNQRLEVAGVRIGPDEGVLDAADMLDKDARAEAELGKGRGVHPGKRGGAA